jgi:mannose-6-phosphate isomerase-like protein (cupin superfamily)
MKTLTRLLAVFSVSAFTLVGVVASPALAQDKAKDAKAAPAAKAEKGKPIVKVLVDNDKVRVTETTFKPGDENASVARPYRIIRRLTSGTGQRIYPDGKVEKVELKSGTVREAGPDAPYKFKNTGKSDIVFYTVVIKEAKK